MPEDEHLKEARNHKKAKRGRVEFIQWGVVAPLLVLGGLVYAPKTALSVAKTPRRPKKQATRREKPALAQSPHPRPHH